MPAIDFIGLTGPEYEMDVERGRIRDFARAMSAPLQEFMTGRNPVIPATFLVTTPYTWGYSLERPRGTVFSQIDHDLSVPLHAEEAFIFHGAPPRAGDRYNCKAILEDVTSKSGGRGGELTFLTMLTEYRNAAGGLAVEQRSVTVTTGRSPTEGDWVVNLPPYEPDYEDIDLVDIFTDVARMSWEDLTEGEGPNLVNAGPLMLRDIVRFQGVVGEDNALHHDTAWAHKFGYPGVFGLGTHQASMVAGYAAHWLDPAAVREFRVRFRCVYWPGDQLHYKGEVVRKFIDADSGHKKAELALRCLKPDGQTIVDAKMSMDFGSAS